MDRLRVHRSSPMSGRGVLSFDGHIGSRIESQHDRYRANRPAEIELHLRKLYPGPRMACNSPLSH